MSFLKAPIMADHHFSPLFEPKKNNGSIRYVFAGTLCSTPFDFMKRLDESTL